MNFKSRNVKMNDTDPTWDAVMRRNSARTQVQHQGVDRDPAVYIKLGHEACKFTAHQPSRLLEERSNTIRVITGCGHILRGCYNSDVAPYMCLDWINNIQDQCNDSSWMDFLQILVHQHAKTIVHLQELSTEVEKLKDFRSSFISSLTADLVKSSSAGPSDLHHHLSQTKNVWTSSPNKLIDSGFSTETKESANPKEEEDPLYSLLDLIQTKVSNSASTNSTHIATTSSSATCSCFRVNNGTRQSAKKLGKLDLVLGFKSGVGENVHIPRDAIRAILRELDVVELQRQLLFAAANVKTLESQLSSFELEENNSRLASKYLALSHENELLRFKLKEQEIQLEGTKAKLRILERKSQALQVASPKLSLVPLDSLPKSTNASSNDIELPATYSSHSRAEENILLPQQSHSKYCYSTVRSDSIGQQIQNSSQESNCRQTKLVSSLSSSSTSIPKILSTIPPLLKCSSSESEETTNPVTEVIDSEALCGKGGDLHLNNQGLSSSQSENDRNSSEQRLVIRSAISRIPTRVVACPPAVHQTHQSISSKSPGSSMSSKSSIPIAVTRLKRNGSIERGGSIIASTGAKSGPGAVIGKKSNTNFWSTWFAA